MRIAIELFRAWIGFKNDFIFRAENDDRIVGPLEHFLIDLVRQQGRLGRGVRGGRHIFKNLKFG